MRTNKINELLERYYNAQTTEAEEKELKRFFMEEEVPSYLLLEKDIFLQLQASTYDAEVPIGMEDRLSKAIDSWESNEKHTIEYQRSKRSYKLQWIGSIAASILIIVSIGWYNWGAKPVRKDTFATPEEAYMEAQKALVKFSIELNKGVKQIENLNVTTERVEENILKQLNKIKK